MVARPPSCWHRGRRAVCANLEAARLLSFGLLLSCGRRRAMAEQRASAVSRARVDLRARQHLHLTRGAGGKSDSGGHALASAGARR
eukprot:15434099-Alexandrium_andersonii.AAC.1